MSYTYEIKPLEDQSVAELLATIRDGNAADSVRLGAACELLIRMNVDEYGGSAGG